MAKRISLFSAISIACGAMLLFTSCQKNNSESTEIKRGDTDAKTLSLNTQDNIEAEVLSSSPIPTLSASEGGNALSPTPSAAESTQAPTPALGENSGTATPASVANEVSPAPNPNLSETPTVQDPIVATTIANLSSCDASVPENVEMAKKNCENLQKARTDPTFMQYLTKLESEGESLLDICTKNVDCSSIAGNSSPNSQSTPNPQVTLNPQVTPASNFALTTKQTLITPETVAQVVDLAGFEYNSQEDIYVTKLEALQRHLGYTSFWDTMTLPVGMVLDAEPIQFNYNGKSYMIELWKGQYYASTGAEIGFYEKHGLMWKSVPDTDLLQMEYVLKRKGRTVFKRSGTHWWLTGFKPGIFSQPYDLVMDNIKITFKNAAQRDGFLAGLYAIGYSNSVNKINVHGNTVGFKFDKPKATPPWTANIALKLAWQHTNKTNATSFNFAKFVVGRRDNSPTTVAIIINRVLGNNVKFIPGGPI